MTRAEMRHRITCTYKDVRDSLGGRLTVDYNEKIPYIDILASSGYSLYYVQGEEAAGFFDEIDQVRKKFQVSFISAAVWLLDSGGDL